MNIAIVEETFNPKPKTVEIRRTVGKEEKSIARGEYKTMRRIKIDNKRLSVMKRSNIVAGKGIISMSTTTIATIATKRSATCL